MITDSLRSAVPKLALASGVTAFLYDAPHLFFDGNYAVASDHALFIPHAVFGIITFVLLALVLAGLLLRLEGRTTGRLAAVGGAVTLVGLFLVTGGTWGEGFMIPYLADIDPSVFGGDVGGYLLGVIALGGVLFCTGWLLVAVALRRADVLARTPATVLGGAALVALVPLPLTTFVFVAALAVVARRLDAVSAAGAGASRRVPVTA